MHRGGSGELLLKDGECRIWVAPLNELDLSRVPPATAGERARAARFYSDELAERYLRAHRALRAVLSTLTDARLDFALSEKGKPYLPGDPDVRFSLSHSHEVALIGAARGVEIGVDVERQRPMPQYLGIARQFFPPSELDGLDHLRSEIGEREFFRRWTRIEAMLKARGVGLYGAGVELGGQWTVREIDAGVGYCAAAAAEREGLSMRLHVFRGAGDEDRGAGRILPESG